KTPVTPDSSCGAPSCPWPQIAHSCTASDGSFGDPGIRTEGLVRQFGDNGLVLPICGDFAPAMDMAATLLKSRLAAPCLPGPSGRLVAPCLPGRVGANAALPAPDCTVTEHYQDASGKPVDMPLPACVDNGGAAPCWNVTAKVPACVHRPLRVMPDPNVPVPGS